MKSPMLLSPLITKETLLFYAGLPSGPHLIARTGAPWKEPPKAPEAQPFKRELRVVGEHAIAAPGLWQDRVGPEILKVLEEERVRWHTVDVVRIPYVDIDDKSPAPIVIWIAVEPGTLSGNDGAPVATRCQRVLDSNGLGDVEVGIRASSRFQTAGPAFQEPGLSSEPSAELRMPFTAAVGFPISTKARSTIEGSHVFFFIDGSDTSQVYLLTARHIVFPSAKRSDNKLYERKNTSRPRHDVTIFGEKGINGHLQSIRLRIGGLGMLIERQHDRIMRVEGRNDARAVRERQEAQTELERAQAAVNELEEFYEETAKYWHSERARTVGFVDWSPPISFSVDDKKYTEDVAIVKVDNDKIDTSTFHPNVLDLGFEFDPEVLAAMMYPNAENPTSFKFPGDRLLQLNGIIPDSELRNPQEMDGNGDPCIVVLKRGRTTNLTIGRINNIDSFVRYYWDDGSFDISMELAVLGYDSKSKAFSEPGDSGSAVVDGKCRIAGIITGGSGHTATSDVTYVTPAEFIYKQLLARGIKMNINFSLKPAV